MAKLSMHEKLFGELLQRSALIDTLLHEIICSKRLLADHIDVLDLCHSISDEYAGSTNISNNFTFFRAATLSTLAAISITAISRSAFRYMVPITASAYGLCYATKSINKFRCQRIKQRLIGILLDMDAIDSAIRRNISYFREISILKADAAPNKGITKRMQDCVRSMLSIVRIIYDDVKRLETIELPPKIEELYEPLGDMDDCIYFERDNQNFGNADIKDIFNIFLLFQSQFLLRLYLIILYSCSKGVDYLNTSMPCTRQRLYEQIQLLTGWLKSVEMRTQLPNKLHLIKEQQVSVNCVDLAKMKRASMDICSRLLATLNRYEQIDGEIQLLQTGTLESKEQMLILLDHMKQINESLASSHEDYQRLILLFNKLLAQKHNLPTIENAAEVDGEQCENADENVDKAVDRNIDNTTYDENKEFFALKHIQDADSDDEQAIEQTRKHVNDELESYDVQVTRSFYAPVLKQLKNKIDPIKADMREREMKFLLAKGIDRDKILNFDSDDSSASDASGSSDFDQRKKRTNNQDRYAGMRALLENKQQFSFLPVTNLPTDFQSSEDILE